MIDMIDNAESLTRIFGAWPSFHDAEVHRIVLDRSGTEGPTLEAKIHVFKMTDEVSPSGYYVLKNHSLVTFRFTGVALERLEGFNHQNVLSDLVISTLDPTQHDGRQLAVNMPTFYGLETEFKCMRCKVIDVRPYDLSS